MVNRMLSTHGQVTQDIRVNLVELVRHLGKGLPLREANSLLTDAKEIGGLIIPFTRKCTFFSPRKLLLNCRETLC